MNSIASAASNRVYEDFDPSTEWTREALADTLIVYLPGLRIEQLEVQVSSDNNLKISGTGQLNDNIWSRFMKEISIPSNYDTTGITANFEKGILYVRNPKLLIPESPASPEFSKLASDESTKPPNPSQETPKLTEVPTLDLSDEEFTEFHKEEVPYEPAELPKISKEPLPYKFSLVLETFRKKDSLEAEAPKLQKTAKETEQDTPKPSKPLREPSKPENPPKEEPSKLLEAPKWENPPQETPKPDKKEPSKLEKPRTEKEKEVRPRKVTSKVATSEQENAGKMEKAEALPGINESGSSRFPRYKNSISGLMKEMKNARNATKMGLAILFGVMIVLYTKNDVTSFMK